MENKKINEEAQQENTCVICFKKVEIYSTGQCDHPVCFECSTRMRVLCRQNECPICRQELPKVIFTRHVEPYERIKNRNYLSDEKYKIAFASNDLKEAFEELLIHECPECQKRFANFLELRDHVRRVHQLTYCDLCVDNLKILTSERRCYTRKELAEHRRHGDPNDRSHRGHPLCKFCETRYMDNDELYRHVRRDHLFCHFCDADGIHQYYKTYDSLREHFRSEHFLCEEGDCYLEKFTSVFRTEIDLKAHKANEHGKALGKAGVKQARTLDIEFSLSSRPRVYMRRSNYNRDGHSSAHHSHHNEEEESERYQQPQAPPPQRQPNTDCREEFPTLGGAAGPVPSSHKVTATVRSSRPPGYEEYPALPSTEATVSLRVDSSDRPTPSTTNFSIQVNHPRFTTTLTASKAPTEHTYNYHFPALDKNGAPAAVPTSSSSSSAPATPKPAQESKSAQWSSSKPETKKKESSAPKSSMSSIPHNAYNSKYNKAPPKLEDFPALAPTAQPKPPPKATKTTASNTTLTSDSDTILPVKSKKKKSKSKNPSTAPVAGTNVKKKVAPPKPPSPVVENKSNGNGEPVHVKQINDNENECKPKECGERREPPPTFSVVERKTREIDEAFPALGGVNSAKAPPGFDVKWVPKRPPPGLAPPAAPVTNPPPGFSPMNGASFPPLINGDMDGNSYFPPPNFKRRNAALVDKVANALGADSWGSFKEVSAAFRNNAVAAQDYYQHCRDTMSSETFSLLFPELLALLPDIDKQQELWTLYIEDKERDRTDMKLKKCTVCQQIVKSADFHEHYSKHTLDNHFPFLQKRSATANKSNAWAK